MSGELDNLTEWAEDLDWQSTKLVLVMGFTQEKPWEFIRSCSPNVVILAFDPRPGAFKDVGPPPDQLTHFTSDPVQLRAQIATWMQPWWHAEILCDEALREYGDTLTQAYREGKRFSRINYLTNHHNALTWVQTGLEALPHFVGRPHLGSLPKCLSGVPGVVVGAGPSLDRNIEVLKTIRDRVAVIAVNSSLGALERAGIIPDFAVALEQNGLSLAPVVGLAAFQQAIFVPGIHVWPGIWDFVPEHYLPAIQNVGAVGSWLTKNIPLRNLTNGGSVSTLAYRVAEWLGCNPVVLVGQDCARGGKNGQVVYAQGVAHGQHRRVPQQSGFVQVPAYGGKGTVPATVGLSTYREWFEASARASLAQGGPRHINATEGGARIDRWEELPLAKVPLPEAPVHAQNLVLQAMGTAPVLPRERVLRLLKTELAQGRRTAEQTAKALAAIEAAGVAMRDWVAAMGQADLIGQASIGPIEEPPTLPNADHMAAAANAQRRVVGLWPQIEAALESAIGRLEREAPEQRRLSAVRPISTRKHRGNGRGSVESLYSAMREARA